MTLRTAAALLMLAACSNPPVAPEFDKPGVSPAAAERDAYECERDARMIRQSNCAELRMYSNCMVSKGYVIKPDTGRGCGV